MDDKKIISKCLEEIRNDLVFRKDISIERAYTIVQKTCMPIIETYLKNERIQKNSNDSDPMF